MDFDRSSRKWEKKKEAERKAARLKKAQRDQRRAREKAEDLVRERQRQEWEEARRKKEEDRVNRELEERRLTGGIIFDEPLQAYPVDTDGDKIVLPVSALERMNAQRALDNGIPLTFRLSPLDANGHEMCYTHAGMLEFTAEEGRVGLPPKVARTLSRKVALSELQMVKVKYVQLERGRFARFQPVRAIFQTAVQHEDLKTKLEKVLRTHTTLTKGDLVQVYVDAPPPFGGTHELIVQELQPSSGGNGVRIVNVELEVELSVSLEEEEKQKRLERIKREQEEAQKKRDMEESKRKAAIEARRLELEAVLPAQELDKSSPECTVVRLRLPNGEQKSRRFDRSATSEFQRLFAWAELSGGEETLTRPFSLVGGYPRKTFDLSSLGTTSLKEAGLVSRQEALLLKPLWENDSAAVAKETEDTVMEPADTEMAAVPHATNLTAPDGNLMPEVGEEDALSPKSGKWVSARKHLFEKLESSEKQKESNSILQEGLQPVCSTDGNDDQTEGGHSQEEIDWTQQMEELFAMGFLDAEENLKVLRRYNGRMARVVNFLSEQGVKRQADFEAKENERIRKVEESSARWSNQLATLQTLGFVNTEMNLQYLEKFKGSMDRVVNALSEQLFDGGNGSELHT